MPHKQEVVRVHTIRMDQIQFLVSATSSGCGKTTFTLGLLRSLQRRGLSLASFKCGPDYIDPKFHELASGHPSTNLDQYMMSREHILDVYARRSDGVDCVLIEGVMGLYDGAVKMQGSSASLAQLLDIPVVLLVNAASSAYSVGAIIYGFARWQPGVRVAGVVFNRVASESHYQFLLDAASDAGVPVLGYIPKDSGLEVPSRHLGLSLEELQRLSHFPDRVADLIDKYVDVERLLELCRTPRPEVCPMHQQDSTESVGELRIAVARDAAFNFIYEENILALQRLGRVSFFNPLADTQLPEADLVYLPGGYPEFYLEQLEANRALRTQIKDFAEGGGYLLAECGGMMYLCREILDEEGKSFLMNDVLPLRATMQGKKLTLGYRTVQTAGIELRGHEFHYSKTEELQPLEHIATQRTARGVEVTTPLYRYRNVIAGYTHLYWAEQDVRLLWGQENNGLIKNK